MVADAIKMILFPAVMAFAASSDLLTMKISNRVSIILIAGFFLLALVTGLNSAMVMAHVGAAIMVLAISFLLFSRGWIGGGDAKLAAATALWIGFEHLLTYLLYASLFGGLLTLVLLIVRTLPLPALLVDKPWAARLHRKDTGVPYGVALAAAALVVYPDTIWLRAIAG